MLPEDARRASPAGFACGDSYLTFLTLVNCGCGHWVFVVPASETALLALTPSRALCLARPPFAPGALSATIEPREDSISISIATSTRKQCPSRADETACRCRTAAWERDGVAGSALALPLLRLAHALRLAQARTPSWPLAMCLPDAAACPPALDSSQRAICQQAPEGEKGPAAAAARSRAAQRAASRDVAYATR